MHPDYARIIRDIAKPDIERQLALADLFSLCSCYMELKSIHIRGADPTLEIERLNKSVESLLSSRSTTEFGKSPKLTRLFVTQGIELIAMCGANDTLDLFASGPIDENSYEKRQTLIRWMSLIVLAVYRANERYDEPSFMPREVQEAISALDYGEVPDLFMPSRRRGKERKSHSIAMTKLAYIKCLKQLAKSGLTPQAANKISREASGMDPGTVRKWRSAAKRQLSPMDRNRAKQDHRHFMEHEPSVKEISKRLCDLGSRIQSLARESKGLG